MQESLFEVMARDLFRRRQPTELAEALEVQPGVVVDERLQTSLLRELSSYDPSFYLFVKPEARVAYQAANNVLAWLERATGSAENKQATIYALNTLTNVFYAALHRDPTGTAFGPALFGSESDYCSAVEATNSQLHALLQRFGNDEEIVRAAISLRDALHISPKIFVETILQHLQGQLVREVPPGETLAGAESLPVQFALLDRLIVSQDGLAGFVDQIRFTISSAQCVPLPTEVGAYLANHAAAAGLRPIEETNQVDSDFVAQVCALVADVAKREGMQPRDMLLKFGFSDPEQFADLLMRFETNLPEGTEVAKTKLPYVASPQQLAQELWNLGVRELGEV